MQKTAYVMRISDWSSDVCSSDLAGIYLAMALLTLIVFVSIRRSVLRFRALARDLRTGTAGDRSFVSQNEVSELTGVAEEFDRLVRTLRASAESIRTAAEDNAHEIGRAHV